MHLSLHPVLHRRVDPRLRRLANRTRRHLLLVERWTTSAAWRTWSPEDRHADRASSKGCTQGTEISAWRPRAYPRVRLSDLRGVERASCQVEAEYSPTTKTHVDDIERRLNALFDALNCETLSKPVVKQLITLVQAMQAHDGPGATAIHIDLLMRGSRTDDIGLWMSGAKQLIIRM
ncbi:protein transport protein S31 [Ceratobasidium sp. 394]|nr:protein transport protein S31 [Ceratobasidium sp. 394]